MDKEYFVNLLSKFKVPNLSVNVTLDQETLRKIASRLRKISRDFEEFFDVTDWDAVAIKLAKKLGLIRVWKMAGRQIARLSDWLVLVSKKISIDEFKELLHGITNPLKRWFK